MAEEQQSGGAAESKLGQLYVELGAKGLGGLVEGLNGLSAQFLLTKNAAQQAIKPIVNMSMNAANTVTGWDKMNAVMGLSLKEMQQLYRFSGLNNIDFSSFTGQLKNVQQRLIDIRTGMSNDVQGFALLGLDPRRFDPKKPMELLNAVQKKVETVDTVTAAAALRWLGLSEDLLYVWKQQNNNFDERLNLSDRELENLKEQQNAWNSLKVTWEAAQQKFIANQSWINNLLNETGRMITDMVNQHFDWEFNGEQSGFYKFLAKIGQAIADIKVQLLTPDSVNAPVQLAEAANKGDKEIYKRYNQAKSAQDAALEEDKKRYLPGIKTPAAGNIYKNDKQKETAAPVSASKENQITQILNAKPLNEETKTAAAGLPPLPKASPSPSRPMQFLPSNTINQGAQYTVIQEINQNITGSNAREIGEESADAIFKANAELTSLYNQNTHGL